MKFKSFKKLLTSLERDDILNKLSETTANNKTL